MSLSLGPQEKWGDIAYVSPPGRNYSNHSIGEWGVAASCAVTGDHHFSSQAGKWGFSERGLGRRKKVAIDTQVVCRIKNGALIQAGLQVLREGSPSRVITGFLFPICTL